MIRNPRTHYATDAQEAAADALIESVRPAVDALNEKHPGTWGIVKTALAGLVYNDCDWVANSVAAALKGKGDPSVYIDARVGLKAVDGKWFSRKTPSQITTAVGEIGKLLRGERFKNPRIAAGWSTHNLGGGQQWFKRLAAGSVNVQQIRKGMPYEARKIDSAGKQHHLGSASTLAAAKALALGAKSSAKSNPKPLSKKALDKLIEQIYYKHASGLQINIMDIGKVFKAGEKAYAAGGDVEQAVKDAIKAYCIKGNPGSGYHRPQGKAMPPGEHPKRGRSAPEALAAALLLAKGGYQRNILTGAARLSGSDIKGTAKGYASKYAASRKALLARLTAAGIPFRIVTGERGLKSLVFGDA